MASSIATARTVKDLRAQIAKWRQAGETVALVPTMGALHAGHLSLIGIAKGHAGRVVASIFVNPSQFGPKEDFKRYPRDEAGDLKKLAEAGVDLVFLPSTDEMYPAGFSTKVSLPSLTDDLCGAARPNHFEGVATVVTKLLVQCAPDAAVFGEKDFQQLLVIKRLVRDLNRVYRETPALHRRDHEGDGFAWLSWQDSQNSVLSFVRKDGDAHAIVLLNFTPVPRHGYRVGVPARGTYREILNSDSSYYGGSNLGNLAVPTEDVACMGHAQSLVVTLPPLAGLVLVPV